MTSDSTLMSIAMLAHNSDRQGQDYVDSLIPFAIAAIHRITKKVKSFDHLAIKEYLRTKFGLDIPISGVKLVMERIRRRKNSGLVLSGANYFRTKNDLPEDKLSKNISVVKKDIKLLEDDIISYAFREYSTDLTEEELRKELKVFLNRFSAYNLLVGEDYKQVNRNMGLLYIISDYIQHVAEYNSKMFEAFLVYVKGYFLRNAFLLKDIVVTNRNYKKVTFYLDTPFIIQMIDLDGKENAISTTETIVNIRKLKGKVCVFEHSIKETEDVLSWSERNLDNYNYENKILTFARQEHLRASDLKIMRLRLKTILEKHGVSVVDTPSYKDHFFQIDENEVEEAIKVEKSTYGDSALRYDVESIRSIYQKRQGKKPQRIEECNAIMLTTNGYLADVTRKLCQSSNNYGKVQSILEYNDISKIMWLKLPTRTDDIPTNELLAYCYSAINPTEAAWRGYVGRLEEMREKGDFTKEEIFMIRFDQVSQKELVKLTKGKPNNLTTDNVESILNERNRFEREEIEKKYGDKLSKQETIIEQYENRDKRRLSEIYNDSQKQASRYATTLGTWFSLIQAFGVLLAIGSVPSSILGLFGVNVLDIPQAIYFGLCGIAFIVLFLLYSIKNKHGSIKKFIDSRKSKKFECIRMKKLTDQGFDKDASFYYDDRQT